MIKCEEADTFAMALQNIAPSCYATAACWETKHNHQQTLGQCQRSNRSPEGWCSQPHDRCSHPFHQPRAEQDPQLAFC